MYLKRSLSSKGLCITGSIVIFLSTCFYILHSFEVKLRRGYLHVYNITKTSVSENERKQCLVSKTEPAFTICPYSKSEDIYISAALRSDGVWESYMTDLFTDILQRETTLTVVDIGANIGYFSLLSAAMGAHVIAVEPIDENLHRFANAVTLNNFHKNITILKNAVLNHKDVTTMNLSDNNKGGHRVIWQHENSGSKRYAKVASITMNDLIPFINTPDILIKVDVEGHECLVFQAAEDLFNVFNVKYIIMEWNKMTFVRHIYDAPCPPLDIVSMTERLVRRDYKAYDVIQQHPIDVQESDKWTYGDVYWTKL